MVEKEIIDQLKNDDLENRRETDVKLNPGDALVSTGISGEKYIIVMPENQSEALKKLEGIIDSIVGDTTGVECIKKIIEFVDNNIKDNPDWKGNDFVVDLDRVINNMEGGDTEKTIILYLLLKYVGYDVYYNEGTKIYYDVGNAPENMTISRENYRVNIPHYSWLTLNINGKHYLIDPKLSILYDKVKDNRVVERPVEDEIPLYQKEGVQLPPGMLFYKREGVPLIMANTLSREELEAVAKELNSSQ